MARTRKSKLPPEAKRTQQAELLKKKHIFAYVAERFIAEVTPLQRQGRRAARDIRAVLIKRWGSKPIAEIDREDVAGLMAEKRETPATARNYFYRHTVLILVGNRDARIRPATFANRSRQASEADRRPQAASPHLKRRRAGRVLARHRTAQISLSGRLSIAGADGIAAQRMRARKLVGN